MTEATPAQARRRQARRRFRQARRWFIVTATGAVIAAVVGFYVTNYLATGSVAPHPPTPTTNAPEGAPVKVNVNTNPPASAAFAGQAFRFVLPPGTKPGSVPPDDCTQLVDWAHQLGGVDVNDSHMRIIVQGATDKGVLIEHMRAKVVHRVNPPTPSGVEIGCGGTQGEAVPRNVGIDLDGPDLEAKYQNPTAGQKPLFGFTLAQGETEVFDVTAGLDMGMVEWLLELDLVVGGQRISVEVDSNGKSFVTTAWQSPRSYHSISGVWGQCTTATTPGAQPSCKQLSSARDITFM